MFNKLLEKQIGKYLGGTGAIPDLFKPFLKVVSDAYDYYENDRKLLEHSSDLSSKEMIDLNSQLRREADEVRKTHTELNRILDNINEAFFSMDMVLYRYIFISSACEKIYGYTVEDFLANPMLWKEVIHPEDSALIHANDERLCQGQHLSYQHRIIHRDGSIRWVEAKVIPAMDDGRLVRFDAVVHDITERKNAQIELEKANRELGMLFNNLDDVVYSVDMTTYRLIQISPACQAVYGYTPDDFFADGDLWNRVIHPDDKYILQEHYATIHRGEKLRNSYRIIHKDGSIRWIENSVIPTIDHSGRVIRLDGITRDITEKKAIQHDLEKTSEELNNLFHTIDEVIYSLDISTGLLTHMSPACEKLYGYPPADFYADPELWFKFTHPDDQERVAGYTALLAAGERIIDQCRVINRNKELRWVEYNIVPILNSDGLLIRIDGVVRDITEKKLSEQLLQKSEANLRAVLKIRITATCSSTRS
jgi:PAS domain S-box-containing protein